MDADARMVRALLRRSRLVSVAGSLAIVGAVASGTLAAVGHGDGMIATAVWPSVGVLCAGAAVGAAWMAQRDTRAAILCALRAGRPTMLGATEPEPFLRDGRGG